MTLSCKELMLTGCHQVPVFIDEKGRALKKYSLGGKVLDRLSS